MKKKKTYGICVEYHLDKNMTEDQLRAIAEADAKKFNVKMTRFAFGALEYEADMEGEIENLCDLVVYLRGYDYWDDAITEHDIYEVK